MTLRVTEIFHSLQGEADAVGWPTVFVRLTGCPLRCGYCDTAYAFHGGQKRELDEVLAEVRAFGARHVCVTGGEPLAQPECLPLLTALCDAGYAVSLETSGALDIAPVDPRVVVVMDVKMPIMDGITALPELLGYIGTTPKAAAQIILRAPNEFNDPILAAWQYGLGRSVAFTSDATARWGQNWVSWDEFSRFWSQAVRWTITEGSSNNIEVRTVLDGQQTRVIVDARDDNGRFANGLTLEASVVDPTLQGQRVVLRQVAPGRYEGTFTPEQEGAYLMQIVGSGASSDGAAVAINQTNGWVLSYSPEYIRSADAVSVLPQIATITGGRSLAGSMEEAFLRDIAPQAAMVPLAPALLLLSMLKSAWDESALTRASRASR